MPSSTAKAFLEDDGGINEAAVELKVFELMGKLDKTFHGYPRLVILLACMRCIAAMMGPASKVSRIKVMEMLPVEILQTLATIDAETRKAGLPGGQ